MHKLRPATGDAPCIQRLAEAGALLVGKSNLHEIGVGMTGLNTRHGTTRNPYDPRCYTGGSSSGSAAAVSSGLCAFALGEPEKDHFVSTHHPCFMLHACQSVHYCLTSRRYLIRLHLLASTVPRRG